MSADQVNSPSSGRRDSLIAGCLIAVVAVAVIVTIFNSIRDRESTVTGESPSSQQASEPVVTVSRQVAKDLAKLSPFDVPVGGTIGGIVPVVAVSDEEKSKLCDLWRRVLAPGMIPDDASRIAWRRVLWSQIKWPPADPNRKSPAIGFCGPYFARWSVGEMEIETSGSQPRATWAGTLTIRLPDEQQLRFRSPFRRPPDSKYPDRVIVNDLDKPRLLQLLTEVLAAPWDDVDDFVVTWKESAMVMSGRLRVEATEERQPGSRQNWYELMSLDVRGGDPQEVRFGIRLGAE